MKEFASTAGTIATISGIILGITFLNDPEGTTIKVKHFFNIAASPLKEQQVPTMPPCPNGQKREMQTDGNDYKFICK